MMEKATRARGNATILFEDPEATSIADPELLNKLNENIKSVSAFVSHV